VGSEIFFGFVGAFVDHFGFGVATSVATPGLILSECATSSQRMSCAQAVCF
jgi:hypothetical protein